MCVCLLVQQTFMDVGQKTARRKEKIARAMSQRPLASQATSQAARLSAKAKVNDVQFMVCVIVRTPKKCQFGQVLFPRPISSRYPFSLVFCTSAREGTYIHHQPVIVSVSFRPVTEHYECMPWSMQRELLAPHTHRPCKNNVETF